MKILMWHCKKYEAVLTGLSNRPKDIKPETKRMNKEKIGRCILSMITIEKKDKEEKIKEASNEIKKFAKDTKTPNILLAPFVHLSNNIANSDKSMKIILALEEELKKEFSVLRSHYGYDKSLKLEIFGHKGNVRFREF